MMLLLAKLTWGQSILGVGILLVCFLLIVIILLQKGRGGGLTSAFGGGGGTAFGAKTGDVFTWVTVAFAALYLLLNVAGNYAFDQNRLLVNQNQANQPLLANPTTEDDQLPIDESTTTAPAGSESQPATLPAESPTSGAAADETGGDTSRATPPADAPATTPDQPAPADEPSTN
ncbi:MAG: hypothetical protein HJJLKODD_01782 [Phycisphaerae bacterium]|nr:hypothetical protein [Phycisphaerae bacterium]